MTDGAWRGGAGGDLIGVFLEEKAGAAREGHDMIGEVGFATASARCARCGAKLLCATVGERVSVLSRPAGACTAPAV